jgi:hypothetical protein
MELEPAGASRDADWLTADEEHLILGLDLSSLL